MTILDTEREALVFRFLELPGEVRLNIYEATTAQSIIMLRETCRQIRAEAELTSYRKHIFKFGWARQHYSNLQFDAAYRHWDHSGKASRVSRQVILPRGNDAPKTRYGVLPLDLDKAKHIKYLWIQPTWMSGSFPQDPPIPPIQAIRLLFPSVQIVWFWRFNYGEQNQCSAIYVKDTALMTSRERENFYEDGFQDILRLNCDGHCEECESLRRRTTYPYWPMRKPVSTDGFHLWTHDAYPPCLKGVALLAQNVGPLPLLSRRHPMAQITEYHYLLCRYGAHFTETQAARLSLMELLGSMDYEAAWDAIAKHYETVLAQVTNIDRRDWFTPAPNRLPSPGALIEMVRLGNKRPRTERRSRWCYVPVGTTGRWRIKDKSTRDEATLIFSLFARLIVREPDMSNDAAQR